jgi:hypothetical protein
MTCKNNCDPCICDLENVNTDFNNCDMCDCVEDSESDLIDYHREYDALFIEEDDVWF